jgi:hypothetical protein
LTQIEAHRFVLPAGQIGDGGFIVGEFEDGLAIAMPCLP